MPKLVDHEERRAAIADAALELCARSGPEAVTIGRVADAAGISKGLVQHYVRSKAELLRLATARLHDRVAAVLTAAAAAGDPADALRRTLEGMLALDAVAVLAGHAFLAHTAADPLIRERYRDGATALTAVVADLVVAAGGRRDDAAVEARILLGTTRALADDIVLGALDPADARAVLDRQLVRVTRAS